jgi:hypothetical protein
MLFDGGFTFANFVANLFSIFLFVLWAVAAHDRVRRSVPPA